MHTKVIMDFTVFALALSFIVSITTGIKPPIALPSSGFESYDIEDHSTIDCMIKTMCYLGEPMRKTFLECYKESTMDDLKFGRDILLSVGGVFPTMKMEAVVKEYCEDFTPKQQNDTVYIASDKAIQRILDNCRIPGKKCNDYKTMTDCLVQLVMKNKNEGKCD